MAKKLISIIGSTGIGKTSLAIKVAHYFDTEIISCDSRQFFKEMKIGTAVPSDEELAEVPHNFIGNLSVEDYYSIGQYEIEAQKKLMEIFEKNDFAVLVGGSGMYEKAVVEGLNNLPEANEENQQKLMKIWQDEGLEKLQQILENLDSDYFKIVDKDNPRRLLRAIDIIWQTGKTYTENIKEHQPKRDFETYRILLDAPREIIYDRINKRVDVMIKNGLLEEVKNLEKFKNLVPLQTVGYKELFNYFEGEYDLNFAIEEIKKNSRRYAKRQTTWNKKLEHVSILPHNYSWEDVLKILPLKC
ncbi:MAG: tRNA (adenosine(37)-N6)-dimethylallyltransferase MiaA [Chryseobacterium sp.]|nr:tRNA (adenosine(37)-N6)-dimethylallyltransferase MiaA [Chryseobacterium sp.]